MSEGGALTAQALDAINPSGGVSFTGLYQSVRSINDQVPRNTAAGLRNTAESSQQHATEIKNAVQSLQNVWQGASADQFVQSANKFLTAGTTVHDGLIKTADAFDEIANKIKAAHDEVDGILSRAEGEAKKARSDGEASATKNPDDAQNARWAADAKVSQIKAAASGSITEKINAVQSELSTLMGRLKTHLDNGFTDLPALGGGGATTPASAVPGVGPMPSGGSVGHGGGGGSSGGGGHVAFAGGMGPSGPPPSALPPGNVDQWIREAIKILQANGVPVTEADIPKIWAIIEKESGGNPNAINNWDSNAAAGHPSKGLMQCIDSTFNAHKLPGHDNIYDPVDSIIAGVRYTFDRYGGFDGHPGLASMAHGGGYRGY